MMFLHFSPIAEDEETPEPVDARGPHWAASRNCLLLLTQATTAEEARLFLTAFLINWWATGDCPPVGTSRDRRILRHNIVLGQGMFEGVRDVCDRFNLWGMLEPALTSGGFPNNEHCGPGSVRKEVWR